MTATVVLNLAPEDKKKPATASTVAKTDCIICSSSSVLQRKLQAGLDLRRLQDRYVLRACNDHDDELLRQKAQEVTQWFNDISDASARYFSGFATRGAFSFQSDPNTPAQHTDMWPKADQRMNPDGENLPGDEYVMLPTTESLKTSRPGLTKGVAIHLVRHASPGQKQSHLQLHPDAVYYFQMQTTQLEAVIAQMETARAAIVEAQRAFAGLGKDCQGEMSVMALGEGGQCEVLITGELLRQSNAALNGIARDILALHGVGKRRCKKNLPWREDVLRAAVEVAAGDAKEALVGQQGMVAEMLGRLA